MTTTMPAVHSQSERVPYSIAARELLRNTLLDAACEQLQSHSWAHVTMADIALAAGVSRQTLYKEFGSRDEFARVLVMREADRFLLAVQAAVDAHLDDPAKALEAAFEVFLQSAAANPLVRAIVGGHGSEELVALFTTQGKPLVESAAERLTDVMVAGWPLVARADAGLPKGPTSMSAASVATLLGPYVEQLIADGTA